MARGEFRRPTELNKGASKALEAIYLKAMSVEPYDRYNGAGVGSGRGVLPGRRGHHRLSRTADAPHRSLGPPTLGQRAGRADRRWPCSRPPFSWPPLLGRMAHREGAAKTLAEAAQAEAEASRQKAVALQLAADEMRKQSLSTSAEFAAQMIGNQVDIRWGILGETRAQRAFARIVEGHRRGTEHSRHSGPAAAIAVGTAAGIGSTRWPPNTSTCGSARCMSMPWRARKSPAIPARTATANPSRASARTSATGTIFMAVAGIVMKTNVQLPPLTKPHISAAIESTLECGTGRRVFRSSAQRQQLRSDRCAGDDAVALGDFAALAGGDSSRTANAAGGIAQTIAYGGEKTRMCTTSPEGDWCCTTRPSRPDERTRCVSPHVDDATLAEVAKARPRRPGDAQLVAVRFHRPPWLPARTSAPQDVACAGPVNHQFAPRF